MQTVFDSRGLLFSRPKPRGRRRLKTTCATFRIPKSLLPFIVVIFACGRRRDKYGNAAKVSYCDRGLYSADARRDPTSTQWNATNHYSFGYRHRQSSAFSRGRLPWRQYDVLLGFSFVIPSCVRVYFLYFFLNFNCSYRNTTTFHTRLTSRSPTFYNKHSANASGLSIRRYGSP